MDANLTVEIAKFVIIFLANQRLRNDESFNKTDKSDLVSFANLLIAFGVSISEKEDKISKKLDKLIGGPFKTALLHLEDASDNDRSKSGVLQSYEKAKDEFYRAKGNLDENLADDKCKLAIIDYYIGNCRSALNESAATISFNSSCSFAIEYTKIAMKAKNRALLNYCYSSDMAIITGPISMTIFGWSYLFEVLLGPDKVENSFSPVVFDSIYKTVIWLFTSLNEVKLNIESSHLQWNDLHVKNALNWYHDLRQDCCTDNLLLPKKRWSLEGPIDD
ncbi:MAG: hypothetical protein F6K18_22550 [Okeania sp. SIO2C2]|uniref:hypothetical protein n=1 Tax=Okeania sp. SIO2C2 TaxID=2607787 RepID=UPI0013B961AE|nr:hypothetical protein [Okeania sp. SIO2C2]NEP89389.1 hypothetical protein [Okeania sp. SIO2C2]